MSAVVNSQAFMYAIPEPVLEFAKSLEVSSIASEPRIMRAKSNLLLKTITISSESSREEALASLIFELHNLAAKHQFDQVDKESASVDEYVERYERIEYENIQKADRMMTEAGIEGTSLQSIISYGFDAHYLIQQISGHALLRARQYKSSGSHYRGTWYHKIDTEKERFALFQTLCAIKQATTAERVKILKGIKKQTRLFEQITKTAALQDLFPGLDKIIAQAVGQQGFFRRISSCQLFR